MTPDRSTHPTGRGIGTAGGGAARGILVVLFLAVACVESDPPPGDAGIVAQADVEPSFACGLAPFETEPNEVPAAATELAFGGEARLACLVPGGDRDVYQVTAPQGSDGVVTFTFGGIDAHALGVRVVAARDLGELARLRSDEAAPGPWSFHFAAAAGQRFWVETTSLRLEEPPFTYTIGTRYTAVADPFEPNDSRSTATPLPLGRPVSAYLFAGHVLSTSPEVEAYDDVYAVTASGSLDVALRDVPDDVVADLAVSDASGAEIGRRRGGPAAGQSLALIVKLPVSGARTYYVRVGVTLPRPPSRGVGETPPAHMRQPYTLTVNAL